MVESVQPAFLNERAFENKTLATCFSFPIGIRPVGDDR